MRLVHAVVVLAACGGSQPGSSTPAGAEPVEPMVLASPCVSDRVADAKQRIFGGEDPDDTIEVAALGDLDADGAPDEAVRVERRGEYQYAIYLRRGACGHFVAILSGFQPTPGATRTARMLDLTTTDTAACEGAPCGCTPGQTVYRWDGTTYTVDQPASTHSEEKPCDGAE